jgi:Protein of unknown function (DUF4038)/Putative collagen-binding domain of a collagenase
MRYVFLPLLLQAITAVNAQTISFPLKANADKKYLVDQSGKPVFLNGCASWHLSFAVSYNEAKQFLLDRKAKNFNTLMVQIIPYSRQFINDSKKTPVGIPAFTDDDISQPNEAFFIHVDSLLELCNQLNMAVLIAPLYLGCCRDGWLEIIQQYKNAEQKCRQYGQWFANRYKHLPNLIWLSGGDHNPVPESIAFAEGIASVDTTHLHTFHAHPGKSSGERFRGAKWHTLSAAYTYFPAMEKDTTWQYKHVYTMFYEEMLNNYHQPCFLIESAYEDERFSITQTIRRQAYWSLFSGATGHIFCQRDIWQMNEDVMNVLNSPGNESMRIFYSFIQTIPWYRMKADWAHTFFISGRGSFNATIYPGGEDYATGAFTQDSMFAALYMPSYRKVGINMSRFKKPVIVKWFDPSSGEYKNVEGSFPNKGVRYFEPPVFNNAKGFDDWVLVLEGENE